MYEEILAVFMLIAIKGKFKSIRKFSISHFDCCVYLVLYTMVTYFIFQFGGPNKKIIIKIPKL